MSKKLPSDYHMHTHHSGDSEAPMNEMIDAAIKKGLTAICITEHMDMDYPDVPGLEPHTFEVDTNAYYNELQKYRKEYEGRIDIRFGIELGLQPQILAENKAYINSYPFDFVIASNHVCNGKDPYYDSYYEGRSEESAFREFFESTLTNIQLFDNFDVMGHLDYIVRYAPNLNANYSYGKYSDIIDEILKTLADTGKGLDVNTKSLYSEPSLNDLNPCRDILKRYKELGGEILTFGSDAHKPAHVALGFETAAEIVKSCGFKYYAEFKNRKADMISL